MNLKKLTFFFCVLVIGFTPLDALTISDNLTLGYVFFVLMSICAVLSGSLLPPKHMPEFAKLIPWHVKREKVTFNSTKSSALASK